MKDIPAFPIMGVAPEDGAPVEFHGMTLRDYFAAKADIPWVEARQLASNRKGGKPHYDEVLRARAFLKFAEADAMLKAREK